MRSKFRGNNRDVEIASETLIDGTSTINININNKTGPHAKKSITAQLSQPKTFDDYMEKK